MVGTESHVRMLHVVNIDSQTAVCICRYRICTTHGPFPP